jgi:hypothetical protein
MTADVFDLTTSCVRIAKTPSERAFYIWEETVIDKAVDDIAAQIDKLNLKDSEYWKWHEHADELCGKAAVEVLGKRPAIVDDKYDEEYILDRLKAQLCFDCLYNWPLSISAARQRLAKERLRLRKFGTEYDIIDATGKVVAGQVCWDQVVRYTYGYRSGY